MERADLSGCGAERASWAGRMARWMERRDGQRVWPGAVLVVVALGLMAVLVVSSPVWASEPVEGYVQSAGVHIGFNTSSKTTWVGKTFSLDIKIRTYGQPVDSAGAYIDFDPTLLQVVDADPLTPGIQIQQEVGLNTLMYNNVDNVLGHIDYGAATAPTGQPLTGTITLASVEFQALAPTGGTPLSWSFTFARQTMVLLGIVDQLSTWSDSTVIIGGAPFTVTATADPAVLPVGGDISTVSAYVEDAFGTPVVNGTPVTFTTSGGDFAGSATIVETTKDGTATAELSSGTMAETATITATADSVFGTTTVTFEPGRPDLVTVEANPASIRIGEYQQWSSVISATVRDEYLNLVEDGWGVEFTVSHNERGEASPRWQDTVGGMVTSTLYSKQTTGVVTVTATSDWVGGYAEVQLTPGLPYTITVSADPALVYVGGKQTVITADVCDIGEYAVDDGTVVTFETELGDFAGLTVSTSTTVDGLASIVLSSPDLVGTGVVTATADGVNGYGSVTFIPEQPDNVSISVDDTYLQFGEPGQFSTVVRLEVFDEYGNHVSDGHTVEFHCVHGHYAPSGFDRAEAVTHNGFAVATLYSPAVGVPRWDDIWANPPGVPADWTQVYYDVGPPYQISVIADPTEIALVGRTSDITATVRDIAGNLVADGTSVRFETNLGLVSPLVATTNMGQAGTTLTSETTSGRATVTAWSDSKSGGVDVLILSDDPWHVGVYANPREIPANGVSVSNIEARVKDGYNNVVTDGTIVVFRTTWGQINGGDIYTTTTSSGSAFVVLQSSTSPGLATVTGSTLNGRLGRAYVNFTDVTSYPVYLPIAMKRY